MFYTNLRVAMQMRVDYIKNSLKIILLEIDKWTM